MNVNLHLDFPSNSENAKIEIEVVDYSVFTSEQNPMAYVQELNLEIEDVSVFSTRNEDEITVLSESASN